jgi:uncharacterized GH25 family protein
MRVIKLGLLASVLFPAITWGGQISGTLFRDGQPLANEDVRIICEQNTAQTVATDSQGRFMFFVRQTGMCGFAVAKIGVTHKIYSYQLPVRYDFDVVRAPDGRFPLRRH